MPDEKGTEATRSDAPSAAGSPFGDAPDDATAVVNEQDAEGETAQEPEGSDEASDQAEEEPHGPGVAGGDAPQEALKVVVSLKGTRATIGVQRTESDPHIETFDDLDESGLTREVPAVIERARARWEESPKHPAYERPAPPPKRRNRRGQETAQAANAETETDQAQQTLRLF